MKIVVNKLHTFKGHTDCVYTLEKSAYDAQFFSGAGDGMVVKWNLQKPDEGELIAKLPSSVYALHYHAQSNVLVAGHNYSGIHIFDWQAKHERASLQLTDAAIFEIKSIDNLLLIGTGNGTLTTVNLNTMQIVEHIRLSEKSIRSIAINRKLNEIAVGYSDNFIRVLNAGDLSVKYAFVAHANSVFALHYSNDENYLISASRDARLKIWDTQGGYTLVNEVVAHLFAINTIAFSPDGNYFATGSMDKSIKIWKADSQQLLKVIDRSRHAGHGTSVNKLLWSSHQNQLISASDDRTISVWSSIFE
jgi:WD40 repeat protein